MNRREFLSAAIAASTSAACGLKRPQRAAHSPWDDILARMPASLSRLIDDPAHEVQLLYTRIDRAADNGAVLSHFPLKVAPRRWFTAASWVKLPVVLLTAERLTSLGAGPDARIVLDAPPASGYWDDAEPLAEPFARTVRRVFTISENVPFNRLYEYLGQREIGESLTARGHPDARVIARLGSPDPNRNRVVGASRLTDPTGREIERRDGRTNPASPGFTYGKVLKGKGWQNGDGTITPGPHDFTATNYLPLTAMHEMLAALLFPDAFATNKRWRISPALRQMILTELSRWPRESPDPRYDRATHPDSSAKYFVVGDMQTDAPAWLRMFGKVGQAYGYLQDCAYMIDRDAGIEFMLAATIHANADGIFNDDRYEYAEISVPFLAQLGRAAFEVERQRTRPHRPRFDDLPTSWM
jgi:hypothetical protein